MTQPSEEPANIKAFNWLTLRVLNDLYDAFPERINIEGLNFIISTLFDVGTKSKEAEHLKYFSATVRWLRDEGFLKYDSESAGNFQNVTLTMTGLRVLGYLPTSLRFRISKEPLIAKIKRALTKGSEAAAAEGVKRLVVKLFALAVSSSA